MMRGVSILTTGSEILDGRVIDTNSNYICNRLSAHGVQVRQILSCDDQEQSILEGISFLLARNEILIVSGGLGPTSDDLTREAIAAYSGRRLASDEAVLAALEERYRRRNRHFDPSNRKQALFPVGSAIIENPNGTAAGFITVVKRAGAKARHIIALPGVPSELRHMFDQSVLPYILWELGSETSVKRRILRVCGIPEADLGTRIDSLGLPAEIIVSYRASFPEIQLLLKTAGDEHSLEQAIGRAREVIGGEHIFSESIEIDYPAALLDLLHRHGHSLALADSGGGSEMAALLSSRILDSRINSEVFKGALSYAAAGSPSPESALALAKRARDTFASSLGLALVAPAKPDGNTPLADFYVAIVTDAKEEVIACQFGSNPDLYTKLVSWRALDSVRRWLQSGRA